MIGISPVMIRSVRGLWAFDGDERAGAQPLSVVEQMLSQSPTQMGKFENASGKDDSTGHHKKKGHNRMDSSADPIIAKPLTRVIKFGAETNTTALPETAIPKPHAAAPPPAAPGVTAPPGAIASTTATPLAPGERPPSRGATTTPAAATNGTTTTSDKAPVPGISIGGGAAASASDSISPFAKEAITPRAVTPAASNGGGGGSGLARELTDLGMLRPAGRLPGVAINEKTGGVSISGGFMHGGDRSNDRNGGDSDRSGRGGGGGGGGDGRFKEPTSPGPNGAAGSGAGGAGGAKESKLKVFINLNGESVGSALKLMVSDLMKVGEVIAMICREYAKQNRTPALVHSAYGSDAYELRMVDDDDGTPDDDMPPLDGKSTIGKFQVDAVALVPKANFVPPTGTGGGGNSTSSAVDIKQKPVGAGLSGTGSPATGGVVRRDTVSGGPPKILLKVRRRWAALGWII